MGSHHKICDCLLASKIASLSKLTGNPSRKDLLLYPKQISGVTIQHELKPRKRRLSSVTSKTECKIILPNHLKMN